ncbi:MAG: nuclear transport factor 2 family protein [Sphingobacteriaceae bacterium]|nr:MAG: nuclear transport factor 2 family protein [Sphingobacteriaceae bacterium]
MKLYTLTLTLVLASLFSSKTLQAQPSKKAAAKTLYSTIIAMDKQVFDAYNRCDLDKFDDYFTRDAEFFHDHTGHTDSRREMMKSMKSVCETGGMQRQLVSARIFPLDFYGALETGVNRFYKVVKGKRQLNSTAKFIYIWKLKKDEWKISKVISYDHE